MQCLIGHSSNTELEPVHRLVPAEGLRKRCEVCWTLGNTWHCFLSDAAYSCGTAVAAAQVLSTGDAVKRSPTPLTALLTFFGQNPSKLHAVVNRSWLPYWSCDLFDYFDSKINLLRNFELPGLKRILLQLSADLWVSVKTSLPYWHHAA